MTVSRMPVPVPTAPVRSATPASNPMAMPPITVSGLMYRSRSLSSTRWSFLKPGMLSPELMICFAWLRASKPEVCTQNQLNSTAPAVIIER